MPGLSHQTLCWYPICAGRLTKGAAPVVLLDGRSLGPICTLTTLTSMQPAVAQVDYSYCMTARTVAHSRLLTSYQQVISPHKLLAAFTTPWLFCCPCRRLAAWLVLRGWCTSLSQWD